LTWPELAWVWTKNLPLHQLRSLEAQAALVGGKMLHRVVLLAALAYATTASAQEPKPIKTVKVIQPLNDTALYEGRMTAQF
jgi:hypothetical protein